MLRALTVILVVVGIAFAGWSMLVMTGARDWIAATMTPDKKMADAPQAKAEPPIPPKEAKPPVPPKEAKPAEDAKPEPAPAESANGVDPGGNPFETAKTAEKGSLKSPYADNYESVAEQGHKKYMSAGCNGCHGGTGGGGMGPPLSNPIWIDGHDGETLFRLIALGSNGLQERGYVRKGSEMVVGPMPPHGNIVKSNDDMWKIIAWIWSINPPKPGEASAPPSQ